MVELAQLQLWRLLSPMLPIGAYAYSTGLEYAIEAQWLQDAQHVEDWIAGLLTHNYCQSDIPILARCYTAWQQQDMQQLQYWNSMILAMRESAELRLEDIQLGTALAKVLHEQGITAAQPWLKQSKPSYAAMFALATMSWQIPVQTAALGMAWTWCENQVAAAMKLLPMGQTAGQHMLSHLIAHIPNVVQRGLSVSDDEIGMLSPGLGVSREGSCSTEATCLKNCFRRLWPKLTLRFSRMDSYCFTG